jgi:hypothetical protein
MLMEPKNDPKRGGIKFVNIMRILRDAGTWIVVTF